MSCEKDCVCRDRRRTATPLDVLEAPALCRAKPGECDCFKKTDDGSVTITIPRIEAESIAAAGGELAYIPKFLATIVENELDSGRVTISISGLAASVIAANGSIGEIHPDEYFAWDEVALAVSKALR